MKWQPIETAPRQERLVGCVEGIECPFEMWFNKASNCFEANTFEEPPAPTHWLAMPDKPRCGDEPQWTAKEGTPQTGFYLAVDPALRRPVVACWAPKKRAFVAPHGIGDEELERFLALPPVPGTKAATQPALID